MAEWKHPVSNKWMNRAMCLALGTTLLVTPVTAFASPAVSSVSDSTSSQVHLSFNQNDSAYSCYSDGDSTLEVGESRVLSKREIAKEWDGIDPEYSPDRAVEALKGALPQKDYEELFPYRLGSEEWHKAAKGKEYYKEDQSDYYSYENLIKAVTEVANIKYKVRIREGSNTIQEVYRLDKEAKVETLVARSADFYTDRNKKQAIITQIVDYGTFLQEGTKINRKRELAAFLANLAHETGGGWDAAPGGPLKWGLFWNENIAGRTGKNMDPFVDPASSELYPGVNGKRYYGRGPIMLSWNFNYGLFSSIMYGDKNVLLKKPEQLAADGKTGFMTAILFWLTPQSPKPSAHDVMVGKWKPTKDQAAKGLKPAGFGITIMVLNGLEANLGETEGTGVKRRAGHYRDITARMGVDISGEKVDTLEMQPF